MLRVLKKYITTTKKTPWKISYDYIWRIDGIIEVDKSHKTRHVINQVSHNCICGIDRIGWGRQESQDQAHN